MYQLTYPVSLAATKKVPTLKISFLLYYKEKVEYVDQFNWVEVNKYYFIQGQGSELYEINID